jgi:prepilin-type N-terminal cleavage/methylation domain-containing protein
MINHLRRSRTEDGFTLIELMIVMVVLGILAGIVLFAVGTFSDDADTATSDANDRQCETAKAAFAAKNDGDVPTLYSEIEDYFQSEPEGKCGLG